MPDSANLIRRLSALSLLSLAACATAQPQPAAPPAAPSARMAAPAAAAVPAAQAPQTAEAASRAALTAPEAAVRAAENITLKGTELGTMWTFENAPLDYWEQTYGFRPTQEWLDRVRLSSVKIPGCSASFVSPDGLILTNHHCARGCVAANSTPETDYVETGFYATSREEEKLCPGSYADVLVGIADVTSRVVSAQTPGMSNEQIVQVTQNAIQEITQECQQAPGNVCRVVPLFKGGQYQLYTYKRHTPVKLVMAPELQSGFFGGDYDNFVYPRYALDFSFIRAYESDGVTPVKSPYYFPFDPTGADDGELVFVTGNPGSTARMITVAQVMYEQAYRHPMRADIYRATSDLIGRQMETATPEERIRLRERRFGVENSLKKYVGEIAGLNDSLLVATKVKWEREFREKARMAPDARPYLDVWDKLFELQVQKIQMDPVLNAANPGWLGSDYLMMPGNIVAFHRFSAMPDDQRPRQLQGGRLAQFRQSLAAPVTNEAMARGALELHFEMASRWLPLGHPLRGMFMRSGETPAQAAQRFAGATRILDPTFRQQLLDGDMAALKASTDPAVRLALALDSITAALTPQYEALLAEEVVQNQRLARAFFAAYGNKLPPDATSTLRISDGVVKGYEYNSTLAPYKTVFHGMFARSLEFNGEEPFNLPPKFAARKDYIDMATPVDFVSTVDITGGNSGSPLIDRQARIVGLAFDGNVGQLPNEYVFRTETGGRTVAVHPAGILEALRNIYQAQALLDELIGGR